MPPFARYVLLQVYSCCSRWTTDLLRYHTQKQETCSCTEFLTADRTRLEARHSGVLRIGIDCRAAVASAYGGCHELQHMMK